MAEIANLSVRPYQMDINEYLTCAICTGYLIDASTLIDCSHTFCKSCIVNYLEGEKGEKLCPVCDNKLDSTKPWNDIREDKTRQNLVFSLVPEVYRDEMLRRRQFYKDNPTLITNNDEDCGKVKNLEFFQPTDKISMSIEWDSFGDTEKEIVNEINKNEKSAENSANMIGISKKNDENDQNIANSGSSSTTTQTSSSNHKLPPKLYLLCEAQMNVQSLKHFVKQRYGLMNRFRVDILYSGARLSDDTTLLDVAYIYTWRKTQPMRFTFRVREYVGEHHSKTNKQIIQISRPSTSSSSSSKDCQKGKEPETSNNTKLKQSSAKVYSPLVVSVKSKSDKTDSAPVKLRFSPRSEVRSHGLKRPAPVEESLPVPSKSSSFPLKKAKSSEKNGSSSKYFNSSSRSVASSSNTQALIGKSSKVTILREDNLTDAKFLAAQKAKERMEHHKKQTLPAIRLKIPPKNASNSSHSSSSLNRSSGNTSFTSTPTCASSSNWKIAKNDVKTTANGGKGEVNPLSPPPLRIKLTTSPNASPNSPLIGKIISPPPPEVLKEKEREKEKDKEGEKEREVETEREKKSSSKDSVASCSPQISPPLSPSSIKYKTVTSQGVQSRVSSLSSATIQPRGTIIHSIIDKMQSKGTFKSTTVSVTSTTNSYENSSLTSLKASSPSPSSPQQPSSSSSTTSVSEKGNTLRAISPSNSVSNDEEDKVSTTTKDSKEAKNNPNGSLVLKISKNSVTPSISSPSISESKKSPKSDDDSNKKKPETDKTENMFDSADEDEGNLIIVDDEMITTVPIPEIKKVEPQIKPRKSLEITVVSSKITPSQPVIQTASNDKAIKKPKFLFKPPSVKPSSVKLVSHSSFPTQSSSWMNKNLSSSGSTSGPTSSALSVTPTFSRDYTSLSISKPIQPLVYQNTAVNNAKNVGSKISKIGSVNNHFKLPKNGSNSGNINISRLVNNKLDSKQIKKAASEAASYFPIQPVDSSPITSPLSSPNSSTTYLKNFNSSLLNFPTFQNLNPSPELFMRQYSDLFKFTNKDKIVPNSGNSGSAKTFPNVLAEIARSMSLSPMIASSTSETALRNVISMPNLSHRNTPEINTALPQQQHFSQASSDKKRSKFSNSELNQPSLQIFPQFRP